MLRTALLPLLLILACLATDTQALQATPTCWFPQTQLGRGLSTHRFSVDRVLVWGVRVGVDERNVSIAPMDNWLAPASYNGAQPTHFPAGDHPHFYALTIPQGHVLPDHGLAWVLMGAIGRVHETFFTEAHLCLAAERCEPEIAGFCNGLDACSGQAACDPDSLACQAPRVDGQVCAPDAFCDLRNHRCATCLADADCTHDWCAGEETYCNAVTGTCAPRGPAPCANSVFGCDAAGQRCRECAAATDCVVPDGQFCTATALCEDGQCGLAPGSPCPGQICIEAQRRCIDDAVIHKGSSKPLIVGLDGDVQGGCRKDADCWDRPTSDYAWCDGGVPYCDLDLRQCTRHAAPDCGAGTCDVVLDTCTGCRTNEDCGIDEFWCHPRLCDHSAGLCIPAPEPRCGKESCLESVKICAQEICTDDANCTSTFCGGEQRCNLNTGSCYVVPGTVPCQEGIQGCDESGATCTPISEEWLATFIALGVIVVLSLLLAACCILPYCCAKRKTDEGALHMEDYDLKGRRGRRGRGYGRGRGRGREYGRGRGRWGAWRRRGPAPWWWYDPGYQPTFWERLTYGVW